MPPSSADAMRPQRTSSRSLLLGALLAAAPIAASHVQAQDLSPQYSTVFGGSGGANFTRDCGAGRVLAGLHGRGGLFVDAIGIVCRQVMADGTLGPPSVVGSTVGGTGGNSQQLTCAIETPVMVGIVLRYGTYVDVAQNYCAKWDPAKRSFSDAKSMENHDWIGINPLVTSATRVRFVCGRSTQPASGIRGRAHSLVDALGLICDEP